MPTAPGDASRPCGSSPSSPGNPKPPRPVIWRHLEEAGVITRRRRPGGVYEYKVDPRFLPRAPVSHPRAEGVPRQGGQETEPLKQKEARKRDQFAKSGIELRRDPRRPREMGGAAAQLAHVAVLAAALGTEADRAGLLRAGRGARSWRLIASELTRDDHRPVPPNTAPGVPAANRSACRSAYKRRMSGEGTTWRLTPWRRRSWRPDAADPR